MSSFKTKHLILAAVDTHQYLLTRSDSHGIGILNNRVGEETSVSLFGTGTSLNLFRVGSMANTTNAEYLQIRSDPTLGRYSVASVASGTGQTRDIDFNHGQLILRAAQGPVEIGSVAVPASYNDGGGALTVKGGAGIAVLHLGPAVVPGSTNPSSPQSGALNVEGDTVTNGTVLFTSSKTPQAPTVATRSSGTRLVVRPTVSGTTVDYALGHSTDAMWISVPSSLASLKFYTGTLEMARLSRQGRLTLSPSQSYTYTPDSAAHLLNVPPTTFLDPVSVSSATSFIANRFGTPTLEASNVLVTDKAATLFIQGAPVAGANQTINQSYALWVGDGRVQIDSGMSDALTVVGGARVLKTLTVGTDSRGLVATLAAATHVTVDSTSDVSAVFVGRSTLHSSSTTPASATTLFLEGPPISTAADVFALRIGQGTFKTSDPTDSLVASQGSIVTEGGLGVAKGLSVGQRIHLASPPSTASGSLNVRATSLTSSSVQLYPQTTGTDNSISLYRQTSGTTSSAGDHWKVGLGVSDASSPDSLAIWAHDRGVLWEWQASGSVISAVPVSIGSTVSEVANPVSVAASTAALKVAGDTSTHRLFLPALSQSAPPTFATRSTGTKVVLHPHIGPSSADFALGMESSTAAWLSLPTSTSSHAFNIYGGETKQIEILGNGDVTVHGRAVIRGGLSLNYERLRAVGEPIEASDATPKAYVDSMAQGLTVKEPVKVATTGPLNLWSDLVSGGTVDGILLVATDRVLVKYQTDATENGIYTISEAGTPPTRSLDLNSGSSAGGMFVFINNGLVHGNSGFICNVRAPNDIVGTHALTFAQFSGTASMESGQGLVQTGNRFDVNVDTTTIEVVADQLRIASGAAGTGLSGGGGNALSVNAVQSHITQIGTLTAGAWQATPIDVSYGGTGRSTGVPESQLLIGGGPLAPVIASSDLTFDTTSNQLSTFKALVQDQLTLGTGLTCTSPAYGDPQTTRTGSRLVLLPSTEPTDFGIGIGGVSTASSLWFTTPQSHFEHAFFNGASKTLTVASGVTRLHSGTLCLGAAFTSDGDVPLEIETTVPGNTKDTVRVKNTNASGHSSLVLQRFDSTSLLRLGIQNSDGLAFVNAANTSLSLGSSNVLVNTTTPSAYTMDIDGSLRVANTVTTTGSLVMDGPSTYFKPPVVTASEQAAIATPPGGAVVFNTDIGGLHVFSEGQWVGVGESQAIDPAVAVSLTHAVNISTVTVPSARLFTTYARRTLYATFVVLPTAPKAVTEFYFTATGFPATLGQYDMYAQTTGYDESTLERVENFIVIADGAMGKARARFTSTISGAPHVLQVVLSW